MILGAWDTLCPACALDEVKTALGEPLIDDPYRLLFPDAVKAATRRILEHVMVSETIRPGEVIGTGTVDTGCGPEVRRQLAPCDEIELEIEGIGELRNRMVSRLTEGAP
ncbi:fumarylacetoacetate hydrolase family protein [Rhodosalinus sp.]|uniref:fumarylacetoacetate hydrolase family protein n=1 Tax=Rhodosalinus sp. TaxID=2047741 RepID=UPI0039798865